MRRKTKNGRAMGVEERRCRQRTQGVSRPGLSSLGPTGVEERGRRRGPGWGEARDAGDQFTKGLSCLAEHSVCLDLSEAISLVSWGKRAGKKSAAQQYQHLTQRLTQGKSLRAFCGTRWQPYLLHNSDFTKCPKTVISCNPVNPEKQAGQVTPHYQLHRRRNRLREGK